MANARALAEASTRSRFMTIPSCGRRNRRSLASAADFETRASAMVSKALVTAGIGPPGRSGWLNQRIRYRVDPPHAGTRPTAASTRPT
jgi:hypothetical protein